MAFHQLVPVRISSFLLLISLLPISAAQANWYPSAAGPIFPTLYQPPLNNLDIRFGELRTDDWSDYAQGRSLAGSIHVGNRFLVAGRYEDLTRSIFASDTGLTFRETEVSIGRFAQTGIGVWAETRAIYGTQVRRSPLPNALERDTDYYGIGVHFRETAGPFEVSVGVDWVHLAEQSTSEIRLQGNAWVYLWRNFALGLHYAHRPDEAIRGIAFRFSF
ncbi:MAG: hypothetical protein JJU10_06490 [Idiomarina sp.]|nr:hypothetical protein [Idiomarina sp.]